MTTSHQLTLLALLLSYWWREITVVSVTHAFVAVRLDASMPARQSSPQRLYRDDVLALLASKSSSTATGFGARVEDSKKGKKGASKSNLSNKLRSVSSQHTGAGSKPLRQAALTFDRIRKTLGKEACMDVYLRSPLDSPTTFWFVGKVASENIATGAKAPSTSSPAADLDGDAVSIDDSAVAPPEFVAACLSQKRIILEYSMQHLRPHNFGGKFASTLELWLAPPDSEMDVAQNKVTLRPVKGSAADLPDTFHVDTVGYNPEIYVGEEVTDGGLRVERDEQGRPTKPVFEVNEAF